MTQTDNDAPLIYLVDDDEAFRKSLQWMFRAAGFRLEMFATGEHFLARYEPGAGACLILDVRLPGMNGLQLQEELTERREWIPTIFVTAHGDVPLAVRAVKRGAFDFLEKPFNGRYLITLVRKALRQDPRELAAAAERLTMAERIASLSEREHDVMRRVVDGKTNKAIAAELGISVKTVECHRSRMMVKLGMTSIAELARNVFSSSAKAS